METESLPCTLWKSFQASAAATAAATGCPIEDPTSSLSSTPLFGAVRNGHEDLALEMLRLPRQENLDLERLIKGATLLMYAALQGATRLVQELLIHGADLDGRLDRHSGLCMAVVKCSTDAMNVLLEEYQARGRLEEAMDPPCLDKDGRPTPLIQHLTTLLHRDSAAQLSIMRVLVSKWGANVRAILIGIPGPYLVLHEAAAKGILPLVKYFVEECGLSVDEPTPGGHHTPLMFACEYKGSVPETHLIPVIKYLLENGADTTRRTAEGYTAEEIATIAGLDEVRKLLVSHRRIKQAQRKREEKAANEVAVDAVSFAAKQREADVAAQALLMELDAEEAPSDQKKGKSNRGSGAKLKTSGGSIRQGLRQGEKKEERDEEKEDGTGKEDKEGKMDGSRKYEERTQHDSHEQRKCKQKEEVGEAIIAGVAAATHGMSLAEGEGDISGEPKLSATSAALVLTEDDIWETAPDEYKCPLDLCLAIGGFMYSKKGLEGWIAHCAAKGLPLTSPKTGEVMDAAFMVNKTYRTLVRDWVEAQKVAAQK